MKLLPDGFRNSESTKMNRLLIASIALGYWLSINPLFAASIDDFLGTWVGDEEGKGDGKDCSPDIIDTEHNGFEILKDDFGWGAGGFCEHIKMKVKGEVLTITGECRIEEDVTTDLYLTLRKMKNGKLETDGDVQSVYHRCPEQ